MTFRKINAAVSRRPALPAAALFILGISVHPLLPSWPAAWLVCIGVLLVGALVFLRRSAACSPLIALAILLSGTCSAQLSATNYSRHHIGLFAGDVPRLAWIEGEIRETPRRVEPAPAGHPLPDRQVLSLAVHAVRSWNGWVPATGGIPVTISPPAPGLAAGDVVRLVGRLERPGPAMNPGGFDAATHYRRERVLAALHVSRPYDVQILSTAPRFTSPLVKARDAARELLDRGFGSSHSADRALLGALVFGDREPALRDVQDDFTRSGTTHLLAANGSRIALLAGAVYILCRLLRLSPRHAAVALTLSVAFFGFLTMPAAEAVRPAIIFAAVGFGTLGRRTVDSLQLLALAAVAILVPRPLDFYGAGFQLSFVIVLGMIVLTGPALRFIEGFENKDRKVADSFQRPTHLRRAVGWIKLWLIRGLVVGSVAWAAALPLVAYHFEQLNPWTVPFGLLLSPPAVIALGCGFLKIALTAVCPPLAATWASAAAPGAGLLRVLVHAMAAAPLADLPLARPAVGSILLYYLLLSLPLIAWPRPRIRWCARCAPVGGCVMLFALPLCGGLAPLHGAAPVLRLTLLSVGAGQCAVVEPSGGGAVLFDAGSSTINDPLRTCIEPFLRHEQCRTIDTIFLSHGDYDHIGAVSGIVPEYGVRQVVTTPHFRRHAHESKPCEALLALLDATGHTPRTLTTGDRVRIGPDAEIQVLWPPADCPFNSNNTGMVVRLTCAGRSILFPADIQEPAERELLKHPDMLRSDILIAPHHGSCEATTVQFIAAVSPKLILASNDARLTMKQRLFDRSVGDFPLYRTSRCGALTVEVSRDGTIRLTPFLPVPLVTLPPTR